MIKTKRVYDPPADDDGLLAAMREDVTLLCGCKSETQCHRYLLRDLIEKARQA